MPYSIPADQALPIVPPSEPQPVSSPKSDSGIPSRPRTPPRLTINTTPPTPTSPSSGGDVRSPTSTRGYLQYSPTSTYAQHSPTATTQNRQMPYSSGRAGHRRSYTYMYPHHLDEAMGANGNVEASPKDANGRTNTNGTNANTYDIHSTPLNNHLPRRRSASSASSGGQTALGSTTAETATATAAVANGNGTTTNVYKKRTFQLGQPDDDDASASEDEDEISSESDNNHHSDANVNADAPPSTTHLHPHPQPIRSKAPHLHPHQTHTHIPLHPHTHTHVRQHPGDEDEEERHPGLPPLKLKLKQQREPSFGAVPFPRSSPLHSPVPAGVAVPAASPVGGVGRQGAYPFPHTASKSGSQPQPTEPTQTQTHLRVSSETTTPSNALSNTTTSSATSDTTNPTRPIFQRASSTPLILLANGRPLKSSLKSSSSSPNIPFPSQSMVPSILWPDLHQRATAGAEGGEREGGGQGQGLLEPERHHVVHQRAASAPSVPSSLSISGASSPPTTQSPPPSSSSSSSSPSTNRIHSPKPHAHRDSHAHHAHVHAHAPAPHKNVHFPSSEEGGLATVRVFNRSARPASLSLPAGARLGEETETETEGTGTEGEGWGGVMRWRGFGTGKGHFFPRINGHSPASGASAGGKPEVPPVGKEEEGDVQIDDEKSSYIPRIDAHLGDANVYLESLGFVRDATTERPTTRPLKIIGTILVRNIAYQKTVAVRFTLDDWHTTNDVLAKHERSLGALPEGIRRSGAGVRDREKRVTDHVANHSSTLVTPVWDRFRFDIRMSDYEESVRGGRVRGMWIVARYSTDGSEGPDGGGVVAGMEGKAREWWDNNAGGNYWVGFRCVSGANGGGKERERRRALVSAPSAFSPSGNPNANPANSLTAAAKKAYPAPPQISVSRSFPAYYSPSSSPSCFSPSLSPPSSYSAPPSSPPYSPPSGYHRPRTHANAATEDFKHGEYDEGRTPTQAPADRHQHHQAQLQRQEQQMQLQQAQLQQHQQHQAALKQCTFSRLRRLNLGRMNYAAPAGAAAAKVVNESSGSTGASPVSPDTSPTAMIGTPSPDNSTCTSVESTPVQTPTQGYEDDHDHDGYAHDVNVDILLPDHGGGSFSAGRLPYMGMQNGHPATVMGLENMKPGTPTPVPSPTGSSTTSTPGMEMRMVASPLPLSELGDGGDKVTTPPVSSSPATSTTTALHPSSLYWPWGSEVGGAEFSGVGVETRARAFDDHDHEHEVEGGRGGADSGKTLPPPVADLLRDIKEKSMRGSSSTGVGGALVPPRRRRRGTQGPQQHNQKDQQGEEEQEHADDQQRKKSTTFSIGGSSSSSTSSSGSDTPSSRSRHHLEGHGHLHKHRKHASPPGVLPAPATNTISGPNSTSTSSGTGSSSAGPLTAPTPTWALRPGSPHPLSGIGMGIGSENGTRSVSPRKVGMGSVVQPVMTPVSSQASMTTGMDPSSTTPLSSSPPRSPQQTEDPVYQAFVRQWCFAQAPGPTVGGSVSVGGGRGKNGHGRVGIGGTGRGSSTPGGSGSGVSPGGGGGLSLGRVGVDG